MTPDEQRRFASERFDGPQHPEPQGETELEAWEDWSLIADHLDKAEVVSLPPDFAQQVQRAIRRAQSRRDVALVLQTAGVTGLVLAGVATWALRFQWWERLVAAVHPGKLASLLPALPPGVSTQVPDFAALGQRAEPFLPLLPPALLAAATLVLLIELAVFRLLRLGPFRLKPSILRTSHNFVS